MGRPRRPSPNEPLTAPFAVLIDTREQLPYSFAGLVADARDQRRPLVVPLQMGTLREGDYGVVGLPGVAVERKSLADAFGTFSTGRERFERELARLSELDFAAVVIEADWPTILRGAPHSRLNPRTVYRSVIAWQQRYRVAWWACPDRRFAEITTYRILERYWRDHAGGRA